MKRARDIIAEINAQFAKSSTVNEAKEGAMLFTSDIEINDYPQKARWKVTNKVSFDKNCLGSPTLTLTLPEQESMSQLFEATGASELQLEASLSHQGNLYRETKGNCIYLLKAKARLLLIMPRQRLSGC